MLIKEQNDGTRIIFSGSSGLRAKMLFGIYVLVYASVVIFCIALAVLPIRSGKIVLGLFPVAAAVGFAIICWRFLSRITTKEELLLTANHLKLTRQVNGRKNESIFLIDGIQNLCYVGNGATAYHQLQSDNLDALGFGMRQNLVHSVMSEGNVVFFFDAKQVRFGTDLSSWDTERLNELLKDKTGGRLDIAGLPEDIPESVWNR